MPVLQLSESIEMYLKAVLELSNDEAVAISRLAKRLTVTSVSANEMVQRLSAQGLITHKPYKGVKLTKKGREVAFNVMRRQRLWECFLYDHLKIDWAKLYDLACSLEHATAPDVTEALSVFLGSPKICPHGNPIPTADGSFKSLPGIPLSEASIGKAAIILAIHATSTDALEHIHKLNCLPGREITVLDVAPMQGPFMLQVEGKEVALGRQLAELVLVKQKLP